MLVPLITAMLSEWKSTLWQTSIRDSSNDKVIYLALIQAEDLFSHFPILISSTVYIWIYSEF